MGIRNELEWTLKLKPSEWAHSARKDHDGDRNSSFIRLRSTRPVQNVMDSNENYFSKVFIRSVVMDQELDTPQNDAESTSSGSGSRPTFRSVANKFKQLLTYFPSTGTPVKSFPKSNTKSSSFDATSLPSKLGRIKTSRSIRSSASSSSKQQPNFSPIRVTRPPISSKLENLLPGTFLPEEEDEHESAGSELNNKEHGYAWQFPGKLSSIEC